MKNLNEQEKKSSFKLENIVMYIFFIFILWGFYSTNNMKYEYDNSIELITNKYKNKIDSLNKININLGLKEDSLLRELDLLDDKKQIIEIEYEEKINNIIDNSAIQHAMWLDSTITSLGNK